MFPEGTQQFVDDLHVDELALLLPLLQQLHPVFFQLRPHDAFQFLSDQTLVLFVTHSRDVTCENHSLDLPLEVLEGGTVLVHEFVDEGEAFLADKFVVEETQLGESCLEDGLDGLVLRGEEGGQQFVAKVAEAEVVGVGLLEGDKLAAVLVVEVDGLEGDEVEVGEGAGGGQVQLHHVLALLVAVVEAVAAKQGSDLVVVLARERQRDGLATKAEQFHERPTVVLAAGVEGSRYEEEVGTFFLQEGHHLSFLLIVRQHQVHPEPPQRLQLGQVQHYHLRMRETRDMQAGQLALRSHSTRFTHNSFIAELQARWGGIGRTRQEAGERGRAGRGLQGDG